MLALQIFDQPHHVGFGVLVEVAGGLVGQKQRRRIDQRARNRHAALLATGERVGIDIGAIREPYAVEQIVGARIRLLRLHGATKQRRERDVIDRGQIREQARELEDKADAARANRRALRLR